MAVGIARRTRWASWWVSAAATLVSTYALDLVATATGLLAAATGVLVGFTAPWLVVVLVASYGAWALGLRTNLAANVRLLATTGTSTNVLSKAAYELTRGRGPRPRRWAASGGYVVTELAKEVPYYAGAFGAAALADPLVAADAITFLAGANLGAAGYEYALGRGTTAFVARRTASFETDWVPTDYLRDYYRAVEPDEVATIRFFVRQVARAARGRPILYFGSGPTLHHVFLAAPVASELHLGDYLDANLAEIRRWLGGDPAAHDWRPFVRYTLTCEGIAAPTDHDIRAREDLTRTRVTRLLHVDGRRSSTEPRYATVVSAYCADSATNSPAEWAVFMGHVLDRVEPGGLLLTAMLRRSHGYHVGGAIFPSADVDEGHLRRLVAARWGAAEGTVEVHSLTDQPDHGYAGIVLAALHRPGTATLPTRGLAHRGVSGSGRT